MNPEISHPRKPWLAALLSFLFPGLGQMYCGRLVRAFAIQVAFLLAMALLIPLLLKKNLGMFLIFTDLFTVTIAIFALVDAYLLARRSSPDYRLTEVNRKWSYALFVILMSILFVGPIIAASWFISKDLAAFRMVGKSMNPTLLQGDCVIVQKRIYFDKIPEAGDVVAFPAPDHPGRTYIKRVVGLPGQTVEIKNGQLLIDEAKIEKQIEPSQNWGPEKVPDHQVFVLGDKIDQSKDSRHFGPVSIASIVGRGAYRYWPPARSGTIEKGFSGDYTRFDPSRWYLTKKAGEDISKE